MKSKNTYNNWKAQFCRYHLNAIEKWTRGKRCSSAATCITRLHQLDRCSCAQQVHNMPRSCNTHTQCCSFCPNLTQPIMNHFILWLIVHRWHKWFQINGQKKTKRLNKKFVSMGIMLFLNTIICRHVYVNLRLYLSMHQFLFTNRRRVSDYKCNSC